MIVVGFESGNIGLRLGDAGGVCGLKRAANLSISDSSWGLCWDVWAV